MADLVALKEVLEKVPLPERIVCLGLGSLVEGVAAGKRISEVQLALLLEMMKIVNVYTQSILKQIPTIAYDPVFTTLDINFLHSLGITVEVPLFSFNSNAACYQLQRHHSYSILSPPLRPNNQRRSNISTSHN
jgi:SRR1